MSRTRVTKGLKFHMAWLYHSPLIPNHTRGTACPSPIHPNISLLKERLFCHRYSTANITEEQPYQTLSNRGHLHTKTAVRGPLPHKRLVALYVVAVMEQRQISADSAVCLNIESLKISHSQHNAWTKLTLHLQNVALGNLKKKYSQNEIVQI